MLGLQGMKTPVLHEKIHLLKENTCNPNKRVCERYDDTLDE